MSARRTICLLLALATVPGCTYEEVVYRRPMLAGLPGVEGGGALISDKPKGYRDPSQIDSGKITIEREDGSKVLLARSARHLMAHIYQTLKEDQRDLFTQQVLCDATRAEFRARGMDPGAAFDYLKEHETQVAQLFARMPNGEYSPGVLLQPVGGKAYRLALPAKAVEGLPWRGFDMVWEGGRMETVGAAAGAEPVRVPTLEEAVAQTGSVSGAQAVIADARARQPQQRFVQSGWKLRWFVPVE